MPQRWNVVQWTVQQIASSGLFLNPDDRFEIYTNMIVGAGYHTTLFISKAGKERLTVRYEPTGVIHDIDLTGSLDEITHRLQQHDFTLSEVIQALALAYTICQKFVKQS
jgi:hypothetical protein